MSAETVTEVRPAHQRGESPPTTSDSDASSGATLVIGAAVVAFLAWLLRKEKSARPAPRIAFHQETTPEAVRAAIMHLPPHISCHDETALTYLRDCDAKFMKDLVRELVAWKPGDLADERAYQKSLHALLSSRKLPLAPLDKGRIRSDVWGGIPDLIIGDSTKHPAKNGAPKAILIEMKDGRTKGALRSSDIDRLEGQANRYLRIAANYPLIWVFCRTDRNDSSKIQHIVEDFRKRDLAVIAFFV